VRVKGPRPTVGTNLQVCPPAACPSSTIRARVHPRRGPGSSLAVTPTVVPCGSPGAPAHGASRRIGKWRRAPYSRLGPQPLHRRPQTPLLSTFSFLLSRPQAAGHHGSTRPPGVVPPSPSIGYHANICSVGWGPLRGVPPTGGTRGDGGETTHMNGIRADQGLFDAARLASEPGG